MPVELMPERLEKKPFYSSASVFFKWWLVIFDIIFIYGFIWEQSHKQVSGDLEKFYFIF